MNVKELYITDEMLKDLDALYTNVEGKRDPVQRHANWGILVEELRKIRRQVESGVVVKIEGSTTVLTSWQDFYAWAHGRYHMLEEGSDHWIGDDNS